MSYLPFGALPGEFIDVDQETLISPVVDSELRKGKTQECPSGQVFSSKYTDCVPACPRNEEWNRGYAVCLPVKYPSCLPSETKYQTAYKHPSGKMVAVTLCRPSHEGAPTCPTGQIFKPGIGCQETSAYRAIAQGPTSCGKRGIPSDYFQCAKALVIQAAREGDLPPKFGGTIEEVTAWLGQPAAGQTGDHSSFAANWISIQWKKGNLIRIGGYLSHLKSQYPQEREEIEAWEEAKAAAEAAAAAAPGQQPPSASKWLLPVALAGAALAAVLILKKKGKL